MILEKFYSLVKDGTQNLVSHPQLLLTLILILLIPVAFIKSSNEFLRVSKANYERLEKDRIGLLHDVFASYLSGVDYDPARVQEQIEYLVARNPDITQFVVAVDEGLNLRAIASSDITAIENTDQSIENYRLANPHNEPLLVPYSIGDDRYWQTFSVTRDATGKAYYIFTETSLKAIDELFAERIATARYWMFGLLFIVLVLAFRHIRLIDYGYLYRETKRANEMKDLFTNMIAHELRAPLTAMRGYASMIRENSTLPQGVQEQARRIEESSERLVVIVSDLLDVARIQSGKMAIAPEDADLSAIVTSVIESLNSSAQQKGIALAADGVHVEHIAHVDPKRIHQALTNLVSNAIKYTTQGTITIALLDRKDRLEIRVQDTGMGIDAENQQKLFAPFFRVNSDDVSAISGTGLGMWITKQLVELMGASIAVESIKGVGTHVVVTINKKNGR